MAYRLMYAVHNSAAVKVPAEIAPTRSSILSKLVSCDVASPVVPLLDPSVCRV